MVYGILSTIAFFIIWPFWLVLGVFKPKLIVGFKEKCGFYKRVEACGLGHCGEAKTVLFYGVSVGEVNAMENLIKKTREIHPSLNIIVLTGTQTGQEIAHKKFAKIADFISYFPFDFPFCIQNMIKKLKPEAIFVMETELWPNVANITKKNNIPLYIINARISDRTYKSYKNLKFIFSPILQKYTAIYPQSKQDYDKFISLGANSETTQVMGNLKFDIKKPDAPDLNFTKGGNKIILAGSTHTGEDEIIFEVFDELKKEGVNGDLKLLIAPRHLDCNEYKFRLVGNRSKGHTFKDYDIIKIDTMGELGKFYSICDVAFIGGSFRGKSGDNRWGKGVGGHNPLEATIFNKPAFSGPSIHNFKDIYAILTSTDAGKVGSKEEMKDYFKKLLTDSNFYKKASEDCEKVFEQNQGALEFVLKVLQSIVS